MFYRLTTGPTIIFYKIYNDLIPHLKEFKLLLLSVGDKIASTDFAHGIKIESLLLNKKAAVILIDRQIGRHEPSRISSVYVIEQITMEGASDREGIPPEPFIIARRLKNNGEYDESGELIAFFNGQFHGPTLKIRLLGKMKRIFI